MLIKLLLNALAFYIVAYLLPGVHIAGYEALLVVAVVWGILSILIKPILDILTLPITIITFGLFTFVVNAGLLLLTARLVPGFTIDNFTTAFIAAVLLAIINLFLKKL